MVNNIKDILQPFVVSIWKRTFDFFSYILPVKCLHSPVGKIGCQSRIVVIVEQIYNMLTIIEYINQILKIMRETEIIVESTR